jgi:RNA polymerase sigma-70 factor (ECF subfamily)
MKYIVDDLAAFLDRARLPNLLYDDVNTLSEEHIEKLRPKLRFRVAHDVGFACADLDDIVQETLARFLVAARESKVHDTADAGAYLNAICRNVIHEYHRRLMRDDVVPEMIPDAVDGRLSGAEQFDIRNAISMGLAQLSTRDRDILRAFYIEEKPKQEILEAFGLSYDQFRVVLCRAKERFRAIYNGQVKQSAGSVHKRV